ncbi:hypothetical protein ILUMI_11018 [Ignelater luminosus]|uniref:PiggyBac transposable element-derived protein domain-containing protein n=1 Tax=Ignelater luminosus TaxID=2038154 RepID=A0A8K0GDM0_IGNLU|nr:hypothetical protein ILUMI_11018 [Ignelater luminosus]
MWSERFIEDEENYFGIGQKVVIALCRSIQGKPRKVVYFDNWLTSLELVHHLRSELGILSLETIQQNEMRGCSIVSDEVLLKRGRGSFESTSDNEKKINITKWADNKCVHLVSSFSATTHVSHVILDYNRHMGGVDLADMLVSLYRTGLKSHRWHLKVFAQMLEINVNNAWLLYRRDCMSLKIKNIMPLKIFRFSIIRSLLTSNKPRIGRPAAWQSPATQIRHPVVPRPTDDTRSEETGVHYRYETSSDQMISFIEKKNLSSNLSQVLTLK